MSPSARMQFRSAEALMKKFRLHVLWVLFAGWGLGSFYAQTPAQDTHGNPQDGSGSG